MIRTWYERAKNQALDLVERGQTWSRRHLPPGTRLLAGVLLLVGGLMSFLPVFGLWMLPLGVAVAALDVKPILRWWRGQARRPFPEGQRQEDRDRLRRRRDRLRRIRNRV